MCILHASTHVDIEAIRCWHTPGIQRKKLQGTGDCGIFDEQLVGTSGKPGTADDRKIDWGNC